VPASAEHLAAKLAAAAPYEAAEPERQARHAHEEGLRLGADGPVEVLVKKA
jgi:hypothetical protein